jgi:hypothetical protein
MTWIGSSWYMAKKQQSVDDLLSALCCDTEPLGTPGGSAPRNGYRHREFFHLRPLPLLKAAAAVHHRTNALFGVDR